MSGEEQLNYSNQKKSKLKVCVVGAGNIGGLHLEMYQTMLGADCEVIAVDADESRRETAEKYGAKFYTSLDAALAEHEFDLVDVSTPTNLHFDLAKRVLEETNAHLIIEKPITQTSAQAAELAELAKNKNRIVMCAMVERFFQPFQQIKEWCDNNQGPFEMEFVRRTRKPDAAWFGKQSLGSDVTQDLGIHDIDLARWFSNGGIQKVQDVKNLPDRAEISAVMDDSSKVNFTFGWDLPDDSAQGIENIVRVRSGDKEISYNSADNSLTIDGVKQAVTEQRIPSAYGGELKHMVECIRQRQEPRATIADGLQNLRAIEAIHDYSAPAAPAILKSSKLAIDGGKPIRSECAPMKSPYGPEEAAAVARVMERGVLSLPGGGEEVKAFEREFAEYMGVNHAVATPSGTTALHAALTSSNLSADSGQVEVLVPALTFYATASIVDQEKFRPVFVDVDQYFCMDPKDLRQKITSNTRAIIPVHLYGQPADMQQIMRIAEEFNLKVIEDAAQAHGAEYHGQKVGGIGHFGCYSSYESKNLATGEGGMLVTNDESLYREALLKRNHGSAGGYAHVTLGFNYNMGEIPAAIGRVQLRRLPANNARRRENAEGYAERLKGMDLMLPLQRQHATSAHHLFPVLLPEKFAGAARDKVVNAMFAEGIPVSVAYPKPLYKQPAFADKGYGDPCSNTENVTKRIITLFTDGGIDQPTIEDTGRAFEKIFAHLEP